MKYFQNSDFNGKPKREDAKAQRMYNQFSSYFSMVIPLKWKYYAYFAVNTYSL